MSEHFSDEVCVGVGVGEGVEPPPPVVPVAGAVAAPEEPDIGIEAAVLVVGAVDVVALDEREVEATV